MGIRGSKGCANRASNQHSSTANSIIKPWTEQNLGQVCGHEKGIQDRILLPGYRKADNSRNETLISGHVQTILRDEIVNPLRKDFFLPAGKVMKLRKEMAVFDAKLTSEEMDPLEFMYVLFSEVLNLEEFLSLSSGQSDYFHQILVAREGRGRTPTIQQIFEESLIVQELKLKGVPKPVLILQMSRTNSWKSFEYIIPSLRMDITHLLEEGPSSEKFQKDGKLKQSTFGNTLLGSGEKSTVFRKTESNRRVTMELFAVICIDGHHVTSFVKSGPSLQAPWVYFDSMGQTATPGSDHIIPKIRVLPEMGVWLTRLEDSLDVKKILQEEIFSQELKLLLTDSYIYLYS
ncbi:ubiquitin carboxyl-terminal hydrolase CYLD isoform X2 [Folsomia candida]|uniref:ubiquitin carboxyl-terminal hydrolase CYLD isoform X2 n=1 Tax=Folsomia candida TaxID=158441 RepID=UPI001604F39A|nr:ubiquitin carboxyl-terminal hydrolase CYLD isoform X2 [Folsomia candida]